ncbi:hypothetical protein ACFPN0_05255 [Kitasatospora cinereorecta]
MDIKVCGGEVRSAGLGGTYAAGREAAPKARLPRARCGVPAVPEVRDLRLRPLEAIGTPGPGQAAEEYRGADPQRAPGRDEGRARVPGQAPPTRAAGGVPVSGSSDRMKPLTPR